MIEIPVTELRVDDTGRDVIVTLDGSPVRGSLDTIRATTYRPVRGTREVWIYLTVLTEEGHKVELARTPFDYLIQINRVEPDPEPEPTEVD